MALLVLSGPRHPIQFHYNFLQTVGLLGRVISPLQGRCLHTERSQTFVPWVGFEPTIPASERANTVHALDHAVTVIG
jgi:hypothetical protein